MRSSSSMSAQPITPSPMRRMASEVSSISSIGYWFISITLSSRWTERCTVEPSRSKSTAFAPGSPTTKWARLSEPRLHES